VTDHIPAEVEQFLSEQILSVENLEVLLLLAGTPDQWWSATDAANVLYRRPESVAFHLDALHRAGLFNKYQDQAAIFRYSPGSEAITRIVAAVERAYRERKDSVIEMIFAAPPSISH